MNKINEDLNAIINAINELEKIYIVTDLPTPENVISQLSLIKSSAIMLLNDIYQLGEEKETEIRDKIMADKAIETGLKLVSQPCTLCGNNCQVSLLEQFKVRNGLCKEREQNIIPTEVEGLYLNFEQDGEPEC